MTLLRMTQLMAAHQKQVSDAIRAINRRHNTVVGELRAKLGMTREEFAFELGVTRNQVSSWENGRTKLKPLIRNLMTMLLDSINGKALSPSNRAFSPPEREV